MGYLKRNWALILLGFLCILGMFIEYHNGRFEMNDLAVYYKTAIRLFHGQNLYQVPGDDFYVFKYSPVSAMFFVPLIAFNFSLAKLIYWLFLSAAFLFGIRYSLKLASGDALNSFKHVNGMTFALGAGIFIHIFRELHLGQVNFVLFVLYLLTLGSYINGRTWISALFLAISVFFKPFGLILVVYFVWKKQFAFLSRFGMFLLLLFLLPIIFYADFDLFIGQYQSWISEVYIELSGKKDLMQSGNHTIFSVLYRHLHLNVLFGSAWAQMWYSLGLLASLAAYVLWFIRKSSGLKNSTVLDFSVLLTLIPLLSYTSRNAFLFVTLLMAVLILNFKKGSLPYRFAIVIGIVFIGGNNIEILGKDLTLFLEGFSIVSVGSLILLFILSVNLKVLSKGLGISSKV